MAFFNRFSYLVLGQDNDNAIAPLPIVNGKLQVEMTETPASYLSNVTVQTLTGPYTLTSTSNVHQLLDPNGANRNVNLPAGATNLRFKIENIAASGTAFNLIVRNAGGTTIATLLPQYVGEFFWDGSVWQFYVVQNPAAVAITGGTAALSALTIDTANANIQMAELGTNAGLELQGKPGRAAYIDLKHDGSPTFTGRWITESATATTLWGGSGVTFNSRAPFQVLNSVFACTTATGTVSVIRFASGSNANFGNNTICWDLAKTPGEDLALYRYVSGTPTEIFNIVRTTGLMTFTSPLVFNRATVVINGNTTLNAGHVNVKLIVTAAADLTLPSTLGAQGNEIEIVIATSGTVRLVQGASASIKWHNGSSTQTGTRTFLGDGVISQIRFTGAGAVCIDGGVS